MRKHTKIYLEGMNLDETEFWPCEVCGAPGKDIHHINGRGMGGYKLKDTIENLMCLCRKHHIEFGDKKQHKEFLKKIHDEKMKENSYI